MPEDSFKPRKQEDPGAPRLHQQWRLPVVQWTCALLIGIFWAGDRWTGAEWSEWFGFGPEWLSRIIGFLMSTVIIYGLVYVVALVAWLWIDLGVLKESAPASTKEALRSFRPVFTVVLLVLAVVAFFV